MPSLQRFDIAIGRFDAANAEDPNHESDESGRLWPKELLYSERMRAMQHRFVPEASEPLRLAVSCQHIRRWEIPRSTYPQTPLGYKQWRAQLYRFHAELAGSILAEVGYEAATVARVQQLVRKEGLKRDAEVQTLEDIVDLVFLESYLAAFVAKFKHYDEAKRADILRKTWVKMSPRGHEAALTLIHLPDELKAAVLAAVSGA